MPSPKVDRPAHQWVATDLAAAELGLTPRQLRKLRAEGLMKAGKHYRCLNPKSSKPRYLWHVQRIESLLVPEEISHV